MNDTQLIRRAKAGDAQAIESLYRQLIDDPMIRVTASRIRTILDDPHTRLFVCQIGDEVCATVLVTLCLDAMYGDQPFAVIENLVVDTSHRGAGLGDALLRLVEQFCRVQNCSKMMLLSSTRRVDAHRFFERQGFKRDLKHGFVKYRSQFNET